jgi:hypothetical protein
VFVVAVSGDTIVENSGEGTDTVQTVLGSYALAANIENLTYTGALAFSGTGIDKLDIGTLCRRHSLAALSARWIRRTVNGGDDGLVMPSH